MKKSISDLFGMDDEKEYGEKSSTSFPALLFKSQVDAHITHLLQKDKTLARHNAMSIYYEGIDELMDTFIETYMGIHEISDIEVEECCVIENPVSYFENLYKQIEAEKSNIKESFLLNQMDEIQQLVAHTLYRLKNIIT